MLSGEMQAACQIGTGGNGRADVDVPRELHNKDAKPSSYGQRGEAMRDRVETFAEDSTIPSRLAGEGLRGGMVPCGPP
jgi:hypothetical protein